MHIFGYCVMWKIHEVNGVMSSSSSSTQDEISLFMRQILLRLSSHHDGNNSMSMPGFCSPKTAQQKNGISTATPTSSRGFLPYKGPVGSASNVSSSSVAPSENETDDCESEEGEALAEEVPVPPKSVPSGSSSRRSRAAEVHNLSEKTDKASKLVEAIEYLKQLQLQVQMLSLRNGLRLHPMFFPEGLQPHQLSRMRMDSGEENRSIPSNTTATLPMHYSSNLPNKHTLANQPSMATPSYVINSETSFGFESSILDNIRPFQTGRSSAICRKDILQHPHLNANHSDTNSLCVSQGTLATSSLPFDMQTSSLKENNTGENFRSSDTEK